MPKVSSNVMLIEQLIQTVQAVQEHGPQCSALGRRIACTWISSNHARLFRQKRESAIVQQGLLSMREIEILQRASRGFSNQQIADELSITVGTTKGHLHRIFGKLNVRNRTAAVAKARALGLL